jgi:hypothetical protein
MPKITKTPPTMPHRETRNLERELFVFVIFMVRGENSICVEMYWT